MSSPTSELINPIAWELTINLHAETPITQRPYTVVPDFLTPVALQAMEPFSEEPDTIDPPVNPELNQIIDDLNALYKLLTGEGYAEENIDRERHVAGFEPDPFGYEQPHSDAGELAIALLPLWQALGANGDSWQLRLWPHCTTPPSLEDLVYKPDDLEGEPVTDVPCTPGTLIILGGLAVADSHNGARTVPHQLIRPRYDGEPRIVRVRLKMFASAKT